MFRSIVYVSSALQVFSTAELEDLLLKARESNLQNQITGVLLHHDGGFMQCLEGPDDAVQAVYGHILADRRHNNIIELMNGPVAERSFSAWQMGLVQPTSSEVLALATARWQRLDAAAGDVESLPPGLALLRLFWRHARHTS